MFFILAEANKGIRTLRRLLDDLNAVNLALQLSGGDDMVVTRLVRPCSSRTCASVSDVLDLACTVCDISECGGSAADSVCRPASWIVQCRVRAIK